MAFSWQESTVASGTQNITCDIEYLDKSYIHVYLDGEETTAFSWTSDTVIRLNTALTKDTVVLLIRKTEREYLYIMFASGAPFIEANVDSQNKQFLHLAQELVEGRAIEGFYGDISFNGYRITNLGSPESATDAANKQYVDDTYTAFQAYWEVRFQKFLLSAGYEFIGDYEHGPLTFTERNQYTRYGGQYYRLNADTDVGFTTTGTTATSFASDVTHFVLMDGDTLRQNLASTEEGMGASLVGLYPAGTVQAAIQYVTPEMFSSLATSTDWSPAILAADALAASLGYFLTGFNKSYPIGAYITLTCADIRDIHFVPASGFVGGAPAFACNQTTGVLKLHNVLATDFTARGCVAQRGSYSGIPTLIFSGVCKFNNNGGGPTRTTTTAAVNTASDYVIAVADSSVLSANDYVWIGDSKCRILTIDSATQITLYNNGSAPTLYSGGTGTGSYSSGQYVTKDADGKNGFTINSSSGAGWNISFIGRPQFNNNAWFGLFQYTNAYGGSVHGGCEAIDNGYIGIGLGYVSSGELYGCLTTGNGNNGLDVFQCNGRLSIHDNISNSNGVDGIFTGSTDTAPTLRSNTCSSNKRIGILNYGRTTAPSGNVTAFNTCLNNGLYDIQNTGISGSVIDSNTVGGASVGIRVEGRNGLTNPQSTVISKNQFVNASTQDIYANVGGYTSGGDSGGIKILDNNYFGRIPVVYAFGFSTSRSKFSPRGRVGYTASLSASAGSSINVSLNFAKMSNTTLVDPTAGLVEMQFSTSSSFLATATPDAAVRTAGVEVSNTATTNGHILAMAAAGALSYNISSTTARTLYLMFKSEYGDGVISLTWA